MKISAEQLHLALTRLLRLGFPVDTWQSLWSCACLAIKDFIYLVLITSWISEEAEISSEPLKVIEYFSGSSRICRWASWSGYEARGFEIKFDVPDPDKASSHSKMPCRSAYDFNGEAGFVLPGRV